MVAELDQEAANHWIHDQSDSRHDLLWTGSVPPPLAHAQPQKVLPPVLSGQRLHLVQLLLFVGSLQSPCPPAQQGEASLHKVKYQVQYIYDFFFQHLPLFPHPHPLLCHGPPVCHSHPNRSVCPGKPSTNALPKRIFELYLDSLSRLWLLCGSWFHTFLVDKLVSGDVTSKDMPNII